MVRYLPPQIDATGSLNHGIARFDLLALNIYKSKNNSVVYLPIKLNLPFIKQCLAKQDHVCKQRHGLTEKFLNQPSYTRTYTYQQTCQDA